MSDESQEQMSDSEPDLLDALIERAQEGTAERLERHMREAGEIRAREEAASQRRLEELWMREHERQRAIAQQQAEQRRQEQRLVRYVLIFSAVLILSVIIVALLLSRSGGEPAPTGLPPLFIAYV